MFCCVGVYSGFFGRGRSTPPTSTPPMRDSRRSLGRGDSVRIYTNPSPVSPEDPGSFWRGERRNPWWTTRYGTGAECQDHLLSFRVRGRGAWRVVRAGGGTTSRGVQRNFTVRPLPLRPGPRTLDQRRSNAHEFCFQFLNVRSESHSEVRS